MNKKVLTKWETDGGLAVIYQVENILLFYSKKNDPKFKKNEEVSLEQVEQTKPYKALPYSMDNVPSDAFISLSFVWQKDEVTENDQ